MQYLQPLKKMFRFYNHIPEVAIFPLFLWATKLVTVYMLEHDISHPQAPGFLSVQRSKQGQVGQVISSNFLT